jgi:hypothetical protein
MLIQGLNFLLHLELVALVLHVLRFEGVDVKLNMLGFTFKLSLCCKRLNQHLFEVLSAIIVLLVLLLEVVLQVSELLVGLLLVHQLLVQALELQVLLLGPRSGLRNRAGKTCAPLVLFFQNVLQVRNALFVRVTVAVHALDAGLVVLDVVVSRISHVKVTRYLLSLLLLAVLLLLEVNFESLDVAFYSSNCCFLCSVFVLERNHLRAQILVLENKLSNFLKS